jgi:hypothetical protein
MWRQIVAFAVFALAAVFALPEPGYAAGGMRAGMSRGGLRAPLIINRNVRAGVLHAAPRPIVRGHAFGPRGIAAAVRRAIPPSAHGFATTTPLHPFGRLARRHHRVYHSGWYFPTTIGDDPAYGYIGTPYDPAEAIPVYGPVPAEADDPAPRLPSATAARLTGPAEENRDACRAEKVTVPSGEGEREITVVRC